MIWDKKSFRKIYSRDLGHDIVKQFLEPALSQAIHYDRITGDFSSAFLVAAARGFGPFFLTDGKMRLITNGKFSEKDIEAIRKGTDQNSILEDIIDKELFSNENIIDTFQTKHLEAIVWLLKNGRLEIKVSLIKGPNGYPLPAENKTGIQHQKIGIISNQDGEKIAFIGGLNESMRAYTGNAEGLQASYSWNQEDNNSIADMELIFDTLWNDLSPHSTVLDFPEASKRKLISKYFVEKMPDISNIDAKSIDNKWSHQEEAIDEFMKIRSGILEMATGTGKTATALKIAKKLFSEGKILGVVIATKGNDLLEQWYKEGISFSFGKDVTFFRHFKKYKEMNSFLDYIKNDDYSGQIISYRNLPELIKRDKSSVLNKCLLICDEIHNIGSPENVKNLSGNLGIFEWKIGLSATPEREYDEEGNEFIDNEFGDVFFKFTIEDAIKKGILCEFDYIPLFYSLDDDDRKRIKGIYSAHQAKIKNGDKVSKTDLYIRLSNVRKTSKAKIPVFKKFIRENVNLLNGCIIFSETKEYAKLIQDVVIKYTMDYHTYYAEDEKINLELFANGEFDCLISCKKISEGIDIKSVKNIILFSTSKAKLETVQRVGRCLRTNPNDLDKRSNVIDFVNEDDFKPNENKYDLVDKERYEWMKQISKVRNE